MIHYDIILDEVMAASDSERLGLRLGFLWHKLESKPAL